MTPTLGIGPNLRKSPYFEATVHDGACSFSVYNHMLIPGHFGDPNAEYERLLNGVAMWDVGAQRQVQLDGPDAGRLAQYLTPRSIAKMPVGQGRYVPLCDHDGWLINDPVLLKLSAERYWLSVADSDIHLWASAIGREKGWRVDVSEPDVSPLAVQGPKATDVVARLFGAHIRGFRHFGFVETELAGIPLVLARSGWSKQGGFELYLRDGTRGGELWDRVKAAGAMFDIGPGAPNDIERLESGLISYGADMRWQTHRATPFEMGFGPQVSFEHDFIGFDALARLEREGPKRTRTGLVIEGNPTPPGHQVSLCINGEAIGHVCEFAFSKRLGKTIGVALIRSAFSTAKERLHVRLPNGDYTAHIAALPFT